jgi:hypothetical protein
MIPAGAPFHRLLRRLEAGYHEFRDADAERDFRPAWAAYREAGFVRPAAPATAARCPDCQTDSHPVTSMGPGAPAIHCPACGPVRLSPDALARSRLDLPALFEVIGVAAGTAGTPTEVSPGVWRLGSIRAGLRSKETFVATTLDPARLRAAAPALASRRRPALFFPTAAGIAAWPGPSGPLVAPLTEYLDVDGAALQFDHAGFARLLRGDRVAKTPTKARKKRAERAERIERLTQAMIDHMTLANAHALATRQRDGVAQLLPRPSQRDLAGQLQTSEASVSRCLRADKSPAARALQKLWRMAIYLPDVLKWRRPKG